MATGTGCTVYADGVRVADGAPTDDPLAPTALSGLAIHWGRDSTVDQPDASTCSFDLIDSPGGPSFADTFATGTPVTVTATATTYPDPSVSTFPDPGFEAAAPITTATTRATVTRSTRRAHSGTHSARIVAAGAQRWATTLAPAPFVPAGSDPGAWDAIPATAGGQRWSYGAWLFVPAGVTVTLSPVLFTGPWPGAAVAVPGVSVSWAGDGTWHQLAGVVVPSLAGAWVGLHVEAYPTTGRTWNAAVGAWDAAVGTWDDWGDVYLDDVAVLAPAGGLASSVLVYAGRVTSITAAYDDQGGAPMLRVTAADFTADLDNRGVGDTPWLAEAMGVRFDRILSLSGLDIDDTIDASVSAIPVSWRDVDRQPATGLLRELASSVDAVLWSATHQTTGPYLRVEDPANRPPGQTLAKVGAVVVIVPAIAGKTLIDACEVERSPVSWTQDVQDVTTRAEVTYLAQTLDTDGNPAPTATTVVVVDAAAEAERGVRSIALSSQLTTAGDATAVATRLKARTIAGWRMDGLTLDDDQVTGSAVAVDRILDLLDGTSRNGLPLALVNLPDWAPGAPDTALYVEGGDYSFTDGRWVLDLTVSSAIAGGHAVTWDQVNAAWRWNDFDPGISWDELATTGA